MDCRLRLIATLMLIMLSVTLPLENWPATACLAVVVFVAHTVSAIPITYVVRRLVIFLPMVTMLAVSIPALEGFQRGFDMMALIILRSTVSFLAVLWLVRTTPFPDLLMALKQLHVPMVVVSSLAFMYRYMFLLWDEVLRMRTARRARAFGQRSLLGKWHDYSQLVGMLLIRSFDRAERVHRAMLARGWNGENLSMLKPPEKT